MIISLLWGSVKICQTHLGLVTPHLCEREGDVNGRWCIGGALWWSTAWQLIATCTGKKVPFQVFCDIINGLWGSCKEFGSVCCYYCCMAEQNIAVFAEELTKILDLYMPSPLPITYCVQYLISVILYLYSAYHILSPYNVYPQYCLFITINILVGSFHIFSHSNYILLDKQVQGILFCGFKTQLSEVLTASDRIWNKTCKFWYFPFRKGSRDAVLTLSLNWCSTLFLCMN